MFDRATLANIAIFMKRATVTGEEALGWTETYSQVIQEINKIDEATKLAAGQPK